MSKELRKSLETRFCEACLLRRKQAHEHKKSMGQRCFRLNARSLQKCSRRFCAQAETAAHSIKPTGVPICLSAIQRKSVNRAIFSCICIRRIMRCYIWSTLLYGAETWTITSAMAKRLEAFEMCIYRRMLKISRTDKISNKKVLRRANTNRQLMKTIQKRSLQFFGHLVRRNNIHRALIEGKTNGKRKGEENL